MSILRFEVSASAIIKLTSTIPTLMLGITIRHKHQGAQRMSSHIPDSHRDLLDGPVIAALATLMPDGQPQVTPVWCSCDGTHVIVNATAAGQKHKNMAARPRGTLMV